MSDIVDAEIAEDWEDALVVRDRFGNYWLRQVDERHWVNTSGGGTAGLGMHDYEPITAIVDADGRTVSDFELMESVIALTDKLRESEERAERFRSIVATTRSTLISMVQAYDNVEKQAADAKPEAARATLDEQITIPRPHVPCGPNGVSANQSDIDYLRGAASDLADFYRPFGSNLRATVVQVLQDVADAIEGQGV